ncbi:MAG: aminotransferase class I/II-fold pyridoxal phosphate-dependent enzyme [Clostridiales bacterium]|nr:aminotransferase class I/II-fold pyridoxal phosphate-dependent enzyme [Clostridiales bacterium]
MTHKHGGDVYTHSNVRDFSANINFRGMPPKVREAAICAVDASVHYPDPDCTALRQALARREQELWRRDITNTRKESFAAAGEVLPEHIICGNGAAELMFALAAAYRPMQALLAIPSFFEYEQALDAFGCRISRYTLKAERDFLLSNDFLEALSCFASSMEKPTERKMLILGNPNNPTGCLIETEILQQLIRICREYQILLVLDESFLDFLSVSDRSRTFSGACEVPENPGIFVMRSFTKIYALPGIRFGYGLCSDRELLLQMRRMIQPWNVSLISQQSAAAAASEYEFAEESAGWTASNREEMANQLRCAGYQVFPSVTNFLLFRGPENLADFCLKRGFLIRSCSNFPGLEPIKESHEAYFRVCVRSREENGQLLHVLQERMDASQDVPFK